MYFRAEVVCVRTYWIRMVRMKRCPHEWRVKVELFLDIPLNLRHQLSKKNLRSKLVQVDGANWPKATAYCAKCGVSGTEAFGQV